MIVFACLIAAAAAGGVPGLGGIPTAHGVITGVADTPEVSAAKAQHFAAHVAARGSHIVAAGPAFYSAAAPIVHHHHAIAAAPVVRAVAPGVPLAGIPTAHGVITGVADTPEVNAAKAHHFAAHAAARAGHALGVAPLAGIPTAHGVITGVADTPEVVAAKHQHFAAHAAARGHVIAAPAAVAYAAPVFSHHHSVSLAGIPTAHGVITGVAETPEVVAAKAHHFTAHAQALARNG